LTDPGPAGTERKAGGEGGDDGAGSVISSSTGLGAWTGTVASLGRGGLGGSVVTIGCCGRSSLANSSLLQEFIVNASRLNGIA
jgi:hypothetical protein